MADPLSITFGVIGTAGVALHAVHKLKSFIESIDRAPIAINSLTSDLHALHTVLQTLESTVTDSRITDFESRARILKLLDEPLRNCVGILDAISAKLTPFVKPGAKAKKSKWRGFVWTFREKDFTDLKALLLSYKTSLEIALSAANLTNNVAGFSDLQIRIRKLQRKIDVDNASIADSSVTSSSQTQTEHGFALKRFLLDTETVFSELPPSPTIQHLAVSELDAKATASETSVTEPLRGLQTPVHQESYGLVSSQGNLSSGLEELQPKSNLLDNTTSSSQHSCIEACIIPDLIAATEKSHGYTTRKGKGHIPPRISVALHLFGFQACALMVPCPREISKFDETLWDFRADEAEAGDLSYRRGDIIRRGEQVYQDWHTGYLGEKSGIYPLNHVRPCTFDLARISKLGEALQGRPLLDGVASKAFFAVAHDRPQSTPTGNFWKTMEDLPLGIINLLLFLIKNLRHMNQAWQLPLPFEHQLEEWSRIIFSDIDVDRAEFDGIHPVRWKKDTLKSMIKGSKIFEFLDNCVAITTTIPTPAPSPPVPVFKGFNLDFLCATERTTIPSLVSRAIRTIESDLHRNPVYVTLPEAHVHLDSVLRSPKTIVEYYRVLSELAEDINWSAMVLLIFFRNLDQQILILRYPLTVSLQRMNQNSRATFKALVEHLRRVSTPQNRSVNNHNDASLASIWTPALARAEQSDLDSELVVENILSSDALSCFGE